MRAMIGRAAGAWRVAEHCWNNTEGNDQAYVAIIGLATYRQQPRDRGSTTTRLSLSNCSDAVDAPGSGTSITNQSRESLHLDGLTPPPRVSARRSALAAFVAA